MHYWVGKDLKSLVIIPRVDKDMLQLGFEHPVDKNEN